MLTNYPALKHGVQTSLLRYHKGLFDYCMEHIYDAFTLKLLINDLPFIISRTFWPGLALYSDFMDEGDFSKDAVLDLLEKFFEYPRSCDVIGLYHIFWLGTYKTNLTQLLEEDILYHNMVGLSQNINSETFTHETLKTFANSLDEHNPVRKLTSLDSMTIKSLMDRCLQGGKWNQLFQLITAAVLIALKGISRKTLHQTKFDLPEIKTNPIKALPLFLQFDSDLGNMVKTRLGEKTTLNAPLHTEIIQLWEEYELCKLSDGCVIPEYPHMWFDFMQEQISSERKEKWDKVYYPKLKVFATEKLGMIVPPKEKNKPVAKKLERKTFKVRISK